jgi:hypothetical protein
LIFVNTFHLLTEIGKQLLAKNKAEGITVNESSSSQTQEDKEDKEVVANKNGSDTDARSVLESVPHKEMEAKEFEENWPSSSEEDFDSSQQHSTQSDSINLKLAENFIFENSDLTQQQILTIIRYQNSMEGELQQKSECFLPPDQPSTSRMGSKEKALQSGTNDFAFHGVQSRAGDETCSMAEVVCDRTSVSKPPEATNPSCSRTFVSIADKADSSGTGSGNIPEVGCSRIGVRSLAEPPCSRTDVNSTCDADIVDKRKLAILNDETVEENGFAARQGMGTTGSNIPVSALNPVGDVHMNSNNKIEQLSSDSDNDADFVEVTDVATLPDHCTTEKNALKLVIQKDKMCEIKDDIFADIFSVQTFKGILAINNNTQDSAINSVSSSSNIHSGLSGIGNGKFYKEGISNEISDGKEGTESKQKNSKVVENIVTQDDCRRKDFEAETDVSANCDIKPEEKDEEPQVAQVTAAVLSSEDLQKLQVQALCCCLSPLNFI